MIFLLSILLANPLVIQEKCGLTAVRNIKHVRSGMETVLRLTAAYEEGSAYTALGGIDRK